ncbi:MAG: Dihydroorotate dehydrogenase (quinone) [Myxococcota bacterium]|nr:Dihydroorotate dehydrogenase (quinone) [Myxococcota bacterium]
MYKSVIRPCLFMLEAEQAHELTLRAVEWTQRLPPALWLLGLGARAPEVLSAEVMGLKFRSPVGVAAGLDKNGVGVPFWRTLGFGFSELGTVTPRAQKGNERPRLFRVVEEQAVVNRLGFNNEGVEKLVQRLQRLHARWRQNFPVGVNIGKNRDVPVEKAVNDYLHGLRLAAEHGDYITVNISSPNTPGLRNLQQGGLLDELLAGVSEERKRQETRLGRAVPVALKVAPDLDEKEVDRVAASALEHGVSALICTNTTTSRTPLSEKYADGGLSGRPLFPLSTRVLRGFHQRLRGRIPLIGVGGVSSGAQAYAKIRAGASLVQIYTGMIYEGPFLARRINQDLAALLQKDGLKSIGEAVGADVA